MITCKKCFTCKRNYPLFLFHVDSSKYQRESAKGKCIECRLCTYKRMKKDNGIMQRIDGKFTFVNINPIKYMLRK
jgi:hypothetical protein